MRGKYVGAVVIISVVMAVLRSVLTINNMETNYNNSTYYLLDTPAAKIFTAVAVIFSVFAFIFAITLGKGKRAVLESSDALSSVASCTLGFIILGSFVVFAKAYIGNGADLGKFSSVVAVLSILSGITFLYLGIRARGGKIAAFLGLLPMLFTLFRLFSDFLSTTSAPFANSGAYHIMSLCFLLLFFLCENKSLVETGSSALFFGFGYISIFLLLVYALPNVVLHCFGFAVFSFDYSAALSLADIVTAFYIAARLNSATFVPLESE